ncbi:MAG: tetratricopeptide repeat protein [Gaiellaceae bacterium]
MSALDFIAATETVDDALAFPPLYVVDTTEVEDETEAAVVRAERAIEEHAYADAVAVLSGLQLSPDAPELTLRARFAESWARMYLGELDAAVHVLERARALAEQPCFGDLERGEVLYRLGCCRLGLSQVANAISLFTVALDLCERSPRPSDLLRARILDWRSRCYQRQREFAAARADVERALELAEASGDEGLLAQVYFQASIVAEREGQWLVARLYAEESLERCERLGDRENAHRVLNNLGGISFLLGDREKAVDSLKAAFRIALELDSDVGAGYSLSSLAQIQLRSGEHPEGERHARKALELLAGRDDHLSELGNVQLVLGRALLEQERFDDAEQSLREADASFERLGSVSHRAAVWVAQGDLATRRGDSDGAAERYRAAAEALQDFHF